MGPANVLKGNTKVKPRPTMSNTTFSSKYSEENSLYIL